MEWKRESGSGKWQCHNAGTTVDHWDACSGARWAQVVKHGERFAAKRGKDRVVGYKYRGKERLERISGQVLTGANYQPFACVCDTPPWELCPDCPEQRAWLAANGLAEDDLPLPPDQAAHLREILAT